MLLVTVVVAVASGTKLHRLDMDEAELEELLEMAEEYKSLDMGEDQDLDLTPEGKKSFRVGDAKNCKVFVFSQRRRRCLMTP